MCNAEGLGARQAKEGSSIGGKKGPNGKGEAFLAKPMVSNSCVYVDLISPRPFNNPALILLHKHVPGSAEERFMCLQDLNNLLSFKD